MESSEDSPETHLDRPLTASERLIATRGRARAKLSQEEAVRMRGLLAKELREWDVEFDDLSRSYHRMLYVAAVLDEPLSVAEMRYLLIARWKSNTDEASLRKRLALGVQQNELKWRRGDRYTLTPDGVNHLAQIAGRIRERKEGGPRRPPQAERSRWGGGRDFPDRREGGGPPRPYRDRGDGRDFPDRREGGGPPRPYRDRGDGRDFPDRREGGGPPRPYRDRGGGRDFPDRREGGGPPRPYRDRGGGRAPRRD